MAITGFTGTTELADSVAAEQISGRVVPAAYARVVADAFLAALGGHDYIGGSKTRSYTKLAKLSAAGLTEGTDAAPTTLSDTQRSITISEHGVGVAYGDLLDVASSTPQGRDRVRGLMGRAYADRVESQILAAATTFTDQVGLSNSNITLDVYLQAVHELEENEADGPYFSVLHTSPIHILRTLVGGTSANAGPVFMREGVLSRIGPAMSNSFAMSLYETDVFKSTNCPLNTSAVDRIGVMLPMSAEYFPLIRLIGIPGDGPFAGSPWDGRYTEERDESGRLSEMWMTGAWGTDTIDLTYGVGIISLA